MKKFPEVFSVFVVYLLTVPTNVMCLGAFTEVWLNDFCISRIQLACLYLWATVMVFVVMLFNKHVFSTKKAFLLLSFVSFALTVLPYVKGMLFLFFFMSQWLGQGCLVGQCRCRLFTIIQPSRYGCVIGLLEALGTCAVFLCPFLGLLSIHQWGWQATLYLLALIYFCAAFTFKVPQKTSEVNVCEIYKDVKFWIANFIIYLPVILVSGLFFHLEGICECYNISLQTWAYVSQVQAPGIVVGQVLFGCFWRKSTKSSIGLLFVLIVSQTVWVVNLFNFHFTICVVCGILGWSLFGVLVNTFWGYLYRSQTMFIDESIKASVGFGFLANALGPILLCVFI